MDIQAVQEAIKAGQHRYSYHAITRMIERKIEPSEVEEAIQRGVIIEEYPDDKYSPSCLLYGQTASERLLHVQVSMPPKVVIITTYEPSPDEWIEGRTRR